LRRRKRSPSPPKPQPNRDRSRSLSTSGSASLEWLFSLEQFGIKFGLDNMRALVAALGHPERTFTSVHVAGTNGKGSVVAMVDAALRAAGHRAARYTSPHLVDLAERFVIDGQPADQSALEASAAGLRAAVDHLLARGELQAPPTFFEATTAIAFDLFRNRAVKIAVCEVGLGGRLDATNVLRPAVTAITTIGADHQQYLGDTLTAIAGEKAGIIKRGVPVVVGSLPSAALETIKARAAELEAPVVDASHPRVVDRYGPVRLALAGDHQMANAAVAVRILELLNDQGVTVSDAAIAAGLEQVEWPGRLEVRRLPDGREVLLDAAHNADGALALRAFLVNDPPRPIVFAAMRDKDVTAMLAALAAVASAFVMTRASNPRSHEPSTLVDVARRIGFDRPVLAEASVGAALAAAWRLSPAIVAAGSIFLLGDVLKELRGP
jgi:dihydrofolate synthase / folylpolyglutamate synthase